MSKQEIYTPENTLKSGDLVTFNTHSSANAETYRGVVEYKDQLGLVVFVSGVQYEMRKVLNIRKLKNINHKNMKEVVLLYSTDAWHSHSSRELIGVFSSPYKLKAYLSKMRKAKQLTDEDLKMLAEQNQTQGNNTNYLIETEKVNPQYDNRR